MSEIELRAGMQIRLIVPDNQRLHGALGTIKLLTEWGAIVTTSAAGSGEYRALFEEMLLEIPETNGSTLMYTGNCCVMCGSVRMVRNGTCELCLDCGSTTGCG